MPLALFNVVYLYLTTFPKGNKSGFACFSPLTANGAYITADHFSKAYHWF